MSILRNRVIYNKTQRGGESGLYSLRRKPQLQPSKDFDNYDVVKDRSIEFFQPIKASKNSKKPKKGIGVSRKTFESVRFKEAQSDYSGLGSGKPDGHGFRNEEQLLYDPLANALGERSSFGGKNKGGDPSKSFKDLDKTFPKPKNFVKISGSTLTKTKIGNSNPYPAISKPNEVINYGVKIRA